MPSTPAKVALVVVGLVVVAVVGAIAWWVFNPAWNQCASAVDGRIVEHKCSEQPPR